MPRRPFVTAVAGARHPRHPVLVGALVALALGGSASTAAAEATTEATTTLTVVGTLHLIMVDVEEAGATGAVGVEETRTLVEVDGAFYGLPDAVAPIDAAGGDEVVVTVEADPALSVEQALEVGATVEPGDAARVVDVVVQQPAAAPLLDGAEPMAVTLGSHRLVVVPVHWAGHGPDGETKASLADVAMRTSTYWSEQSAGRLQIAPEVRDWLTIADPGAGCSDQTVNKLLSNAAAAAGFTTIGAREHLLVYFPKIAACGWAGQASVGSTDGAGVIWVNGAALEDVLAHEFGHNLGLGHANLAYCAQPNGGRVPLALPTTSCTQQAYGDRADVMGYATNARSGNLNSAFADYLGLAHVTDAASVLPGTSVQLAPLATVGGMRAIRVSLPDGNGVVYVDYRPAEGRDLRVPAWAGVQVHLRRMEGTAPATYLLDMQPTFSPAFARAQLPVGAHWDVPGAGVRITVTGAGPTATLTVGPVPDAITGYVTKVYLDLFGRGVDPVGLQGWSAALRTGTPRVAVANAITYSDEYRLGMIADSYLTYLGRGPDPTGHMAWLGQMRIGATIQQMEAGFLASDEYYAKGGGTDAGWVNRLYGHVLGRGANPSEIRAWVDALRSGGNRYQVSMGFLLSAEHLSAVVNGYYLDLLGRGIDPTGRAQWVVAIQSGARVEAVIGGIIASDEYFAKS